MQSNLSARFAAFDLLATLVAVVQTDGLVLFANTALEDALSQSRRSIEGTQLSQFLREPMLLRGALHSAANNEHSVLRFDTGLVRANHEAVPVHVLVAQTEVSDLFVVEILQLEHHWRQDLVEQQQAQAQATKELIRNLAHEIKNPLGGIRGAAQLLQMEVPERELQEYTQVIIHEADRLQSLVDRLLAPHRKAHVISDVNIHEVCERVRAVVLAEFPQGLHVARDYDASLPEFRGDREQLIQALLNITQNAALALSERMADASARIEFRSRAARQVTIGKQRWRLALELHVIDNGPGVPDAIKDRLFYPLVSGRDGGSGLGLTLAQTFIQRHQGSIECESTPGRTDFKILIPLP